MVEQPVWAYICHKDNKWSGVIGGDAPKKELRKFLGDYAAKGFSVTTVFSREEYLAKLDSMKPFRKSPPPESAPPEREG